MESYDCVVIGAGIAGLSVARELARLKKRVLVVEEDAIGGRTASRAAAGILDPYSEAEEETPLLELGLKAFEFYPGFLDEITKSEPGRVEFETCGMLYLALTAEDESFLADRFEWQKKIKLPVLRLSADEVRKKEPQVSKRTRSGVLYPEIPKLNADKLVAALWEDVRKSGTEIRTSVKKLELWQEEKVRGIKIAGGQIEAGAVVVAKGAWAGLDRNLGVKIEVSPVRGQILILRTKPPFEPRHILHTLRYGYLIPWPEGRLLVGSTLESAGFENRVTPGGKEDILNRVSEIYEKIREFPVEKSWAGLRPFAVKGRPLIGPTPVKGLFLACGYYRSGILIAPLVGKLLAEGITSGNFSPLLKPFFY